MKASINHTGAHPDRMDGSSTVREALSAGFTNAVWLDGLELECEARLRAHCSPEGCRNHGSNWVCPPGCGSLEECAAKVSGFGSGILLQSVSRLGLLNKNYGELNRRHNLRLREFIESSCGGAEILALTSGGCVFCGACAYPEPCVKPGIRMNSLSAYGIDVGKLCETAGLDYSFRPDMVYYTALVLMK
jgi:predicted metal-binding protein